MDEEHIIPPSMTGGSCITICAVSRLVSPSPSPRPHSTTPSAALQSAISSAKVGRGDVSVIVLFTKRDVSVFRLRIGTAFYPLKRDPSPL